MDNQEQVRTIKATSMVADFSAMMEKYNEENKKDEKRPQW